MIELIRPKFNVMIVDDTPNNFQSLNYIFQQFKKKYRLNIY